jgi:hypothetical protein
MKEYIVRAPQTDRLKILVPNKLTDLTDYASGLCSGEATRTVYHRVASGTPYNNVFDQTANLVNVIAHAEGLEVGVAGLYMVLFGIQWETPLFGTHVGDYAPAPADRGGYVSINGVGGAGATVAGASNGTDSGTALVRLLAGDYVEVFAFNNDATAGAGASPGATLQLARIAP